MLAISLIFTLALTPEPVCTAPVRFMPTETWESDPKMKRSY